MSLSFFQQVQPKAGTPGIADPGPAPAGQGGAPSGGGGGGSPSSMLPMLLPFVILIPFLFMSFRRQKKEQESRSKLKKGDTVLTQSGLIGELVDIDDKLAKVKIAPGTTVRVLATGISSFDPSAASDKKADKSLEDLKEAKATADKK
jgi:preprotein translocase subunit YajC